MLKTCQTTTVTAKQSDLTKLTADVLVLGLFKNTTAVPKSLAPLDRLTKGAITQLLKLGDFTGDAHQVSMLYAQANTAAQRLMLVGLGDKKAFKLDTLRQAAGAATRAADNIGLKHIALALHKTLTSPPDPQRVGQALAEGAIVGRYTYNDFLTQQNQNNRSPKTCRITLVDDDPATTRALRKGAALGTVLAQAQNLARHLGDTPANEIYPAVLARHAQAAARSAGLTCKVYDDKELARRNMNAILAVGSGSARKPRLIEITYTPAKQKKSPRTNNAPDVVLVGKAVTFDSGGLCIKPSASMDNMKYDKCGGCDVIAIMTACAQLKLPQRVVGLIPAVENLPSATCFRPGDIIRTYSGKTIEISNTDAEGRVILADALAYAATLKPKAILDIATLTGACVIALGQHNAGLFSNNDSLRHAIQNASQNAAEPVWHLPMGDLYLQQMKTKAADLKTTGGREGASCTAAAFLGQFVNQMPWAHIDVAAMADTTKELPYRTAGATGFGVRLILEYLLNL